MFSKLMKYEWKALFKQNSIIFLSLALSTIIAALMIILTGNIENFSPIVSTPLLFLYYIILIAAPFATMVVFAVRFFTSTYGKEGYLTNTLPVTSTQIHLSKIFVGSIYSLIINLLVLVSLFAVILTWATNSAHIPMAEIQLAFAEIPSLEEMFGLSPAGLIIYFIITFVLSSISSITMVIGGISFGQLWKKHKVLGSIVSYVGIYFVLQIISSIMIFPITTKLTADLMASNDPTAYMQGFFDLILVFVPVLSVIMFIALYFISVFIHKKKMNLD
jgi:hypothetical protein